MPLQSVHPPDPDADPWIIDNDGPKVFHDGFIGLDLGGSAAQSVVLMAVVIALTVVQFRYIERKVHY